MPETFDPSWLARREPFDAAARSPALAAALADALPKTPTLLDLGCGTFSLFRWLAPRLARPQRWIMADGDPEVLDAGFTETAGWAHAQGFPMRASSTGGLRIDTPDGPWRIEAILTDLATAPANLSLEDADAVVCSALLDLVSPDWLAGMAQALTVPFLACLSVNGHDAFLPAHPADRLLRQGFARDQRRDKGIGRALGAQAAACFRTRFEAQGFHVRTAASDWRIPRFAHAMLADLATSHARAAARALPSAAKRIEAWTVARLTAIDRAGFALRIGHTDCLALPKA